MYKFLQTYTEAGLIKTENSRRHKWMLNKSKHKEYYGSWRACVRTRARKSYMLEVISKSYQ